MEMEGRPGGSRGGSGSSSPGAALFLIVFSCLVAPSLYVLPCCAPPPPHTHTHPPPTHPPTPRCPSLSVPIFLLLHTPLSSLPSVTLFALFVLLTR